MFAVAIPDLVFASYTLADPVAYPFAMGALAAGVAALDRPTQRAQLLFLALAFLATFARVQYVVLPAAFVVAALVVDRRRVLKTQRLPLVLMALPLVVALASGRRACSATTRTSRTCTSAAQLLHWAGIDLFLLAFSTGVVLVPGALVALARPRGRDGDRRSPRSPRSSARASSPRRRSTRRTARRASRSATSSRCCRSCRSRSAST